MRSLLDEKALGVCVWAMGLRCRLTASEPSPTSCLVDFGYFVTVVVDFSAALRYFIDLRGQALTSLTVERALSRRYCSPLMSRKSIIEFGGAWSHLMRYLVLGFNYKDLRQSMGPKVSYLFS